jgi:hypothetical protein
MFLLLLLLLLFGSLLPALRCHVNSSSTLAKKHADTS